MRISIVISALPLVLTLGATPAAAQAHSPTHWGVTVGGAPVWQFPRGVSKEINYDVRGIELMGGLIRGRDDGGDWGLTFVYRKVKDGSTLAFTPLPPCVATGAATTACADGGRWSTKGAAQYGVEIVRFFPFVTTTRLQFGVNLGLGALWFAGQAVGSAEHLALAPGATTPTVQISTDSLEIPYARIAKRSIPPLEDLPVTPTARLEIAAAIRVSPSVKLRIGSGGDAPWGFHYAHAQLQVRFGSK